MVPFIQFGMFRFLPFFPQPKGRFHRYIIYQYIYIYIQCIYIYIYICIYDSAPAVLGISISEAVAF